MQAADTQTTGQTWEADNQVLYSVTSLKYFLGWSICPRKVYRLFWCHFQEISNSKMAHYKTEEDKYVCSGNKQSVNPNVIMEAMKFPLLIKLQQCSTECLNVELNT